jgi:hypothetical protein
LRLTNQVSKDDLDLIGYEAEWREFCVPPTTHFVAMIDDLTDTLDFDSDEIDDMDEEADDSLFATSPVAPTRTGKWATTSTYDVYMVDTPQGDGDQPKKDNSRRKSSRKKSKRRGREANTDDGAEANEEPRTPEQPVVREDGAIPEQHQAEGDQPQEPGDHDDPDNRGIDDRMDDDDYPVEEVDSFGSDDLAISDNPRELEEYR